MNIKNFILTSVMAGVFLFSSGVPLANAQTEQNEEKSAMEQSPEVTPQPEASSETSFSTTFASEVPSPTPETSPTGEATIEAQISPTPTPTIFSFESATTPAVQPSPSPSPAPQNGFSFFSWKGFLNLDSFFDQFWGTRFQASLDGSQEVNQGDPDGAGRVMIETYPSSSKICVVLKTSGIDQPQSIALHWGRFGSEGNAEINLPLIVSDGVGSGCLQVDYSLLKDIRKNPFNYYINITTNEYPNGAIRGQLSRQ